MDFPFDFLAASKPKRRNRGQILDKAMTAAKPAEGAGAVSWTFIFPVSRISLHARICANAMREMSTNRALNTRALFSPTILANFFATSTSRVRTAYAASLLLCLDRELEEAISLDKMFECFSANASNSRAHLWFINRTDVFFPTNLVNSPSVGAMFMRKTNPCASINGPNGFLLCPIGFNKIPEFPTTAHPRVKSNGFGYPFNRLDNRELPSPLALVTLPKILFFNCPGDIGNSVCASARLIVAVNNCHADGISLFFASDF